MDVSLGPFVVERPLGKGGMGEVWTGRHRRQGVPVAIKVLRESRASDERFVFAFRNEVRSVAALSHPSVVTIHDYGQIPPEAEEASGGKLPANSPYLVMELVRGGSLHPRCGRLSWRLVNRVLKRLLEALAHAHARGVIHRDLKPSNVLLSEDFYQSESPGAVKLGDFGLAHALDRHADQGVGAAGRVVGTPAFMAPEQLAGQWRDYGPWTDLYAVGCLAWALVSGAPPFDWNPTLQQVRAAQLSPELTLNTRVPTPVGFVEWLSRLLEQEPDRRYRRAADAAWALINLGDPDQEAAAAFPTPPTSMPSEQDTLVLQDDPLTVTDAPIGPPVVRSPIRADERPPLPRTWRAGEVRRGLAASGLVGAGLGLFGLKAIPMVGRPRERDRLWASLEAVVRSGRSRVVVLRGPVGAGKSRLARWLGERAHEVGVGTVFKATHSEEGEGGLQLMVERNLRCDGLSREGMEARLRMLLSAQGVRDVDEAAALVELMRPGQGGRIRLRSPAERHALVRRVLERAAAERPVVVWIDDVQWGLDALAFVSYLEGTQRTRPFPVLVLLTAEDEALAERDMERAVLGEVVSRTGARVLQVGPLDTDDRQELVGGLLGLEGALAARVEERAGGNPLYAVQLVRAWVHRGVLRETPGGFVLADGADESLPDDLHEVWNARIEQLLEGRHPDDAAALELAAVMGLSIPTEDWLRACLRARVFAASDLVDALLARRMARLEGGHQWCFTHALLRECLERRARAQGRLKRWHHVAAAVMESRAGAGVAEQLGRHLLAAGEPRAALLPLSTGIDERLDSGDLRMAQAVLDARDKAMEQAALSPGDPLWGEGWLQACRCSRKRGLLAEAVQLAERAEQAARQHGWRSVEARALLEQGRLARKQGENNLAWMFLESARAAGRRLEDRPVLARVRLEQGWVLVTRGEQIHAAARFMRAMGDFQALGNADGEGYAALGLAVVARQADRLDEAANHLREARAAFERAGARGGVAECEQGLGEVTRLRGDLAEAAVHYRDAWAQYRAIGAGGAIFPRLYLGLLAATEGNYAAARVALEEALSILEAQGRQDFAGAAHAFLLPCVAAVADWAAWDRHLDRALALLESTGFVDVDVARMAGLAGELARSGGDRRRARGAFSLAAAQWRALERSREVSEIERAIERL